MRQWASNYLGFAASRMRALRRRLAAFTFADAPFTNLALFFSGRSITGKLGKCLIDACARAFVLRLWHKERGHNTATHDVILLVTAQTIALTLYTPHAVYDLMFV